MTFNKQQYHKLLKSKATHGYAMESLEFAIKVAKPEEAFELHKLRYPSKIILMEIAQLKKAGFPVDQKTPDGEYEILVLAYKAGEKHAKKYWSQLLANHYYMGDFQLSGEQT